LNINIWTSIITG